MANTYATYAVILDSGCRFPAVPFAELCVIAASLHRQGWLEFIGGGYSEDGSYRTDTPLLLRLTLLLGYIRNRLLSGKGEWGALIRDLAIADLAVVHRRPEQIVPLLR